MVKNILLAIALTVSIAAFVVALGSSPVRLGGTTHFTGPVDSEEGFTVDGTTIIDTSGYISSATGTFSSNVLVTGNIEATGTLAVTGETNVDNLIYGGDVISLTATSGETNVTLTAAQVCNSAVISFGPTVASTTTLPSTTTLAADCLKTDGDSKRLLYENSTSTVTTTIKMGAGIVLLAASTTADIIPADGWAEIVITRVRGTEYAATIRLFGDAD